MRFILRESNSNYRHIDGVSKSNDDCVIRAISTAFDKPYEEIKSELENEAKNQKAEPRDFMTYKSVILKHIPSTNREKQKPTITLNEFAEEHPLGTFIVECGAHQPMWIDHLVCVKDGYILDSWDSSASKVFSFFQID